MNKDIYFMPLGGGQSVGASSYFLKIGGSNIILDAGKGKNNGVNFSPDYYSLQISPFIESLSQINEIYISHAHSDHVGYLFELMNMASFSGVYMTQLTKILTEFQNYDKKKFRNDYEMMSAESLLTRIAAVSFMQTIDFGNYKAKFFPAGHIPGAMMILFEYQNRKILYTGDYSMNPTALTTGCFIPENTEIDTVIMCGLHAKHPNYVNNHNSLYEKAEKVLYFSKVRGKSVMCCIPQLSKGIEFLKALNERNCYDIPIYLDKSIMNIVNKMEQLNVPIITEQNKVMTGSVPEAPHIYITSEQSLNCSEKYIIERVDFSLHDDYSEIKRFIGKINPKQAVIVHCAQKLSDIDKTIEQEILLDSECRTQFTFAEEKEIYKL